jgi:hypothetical protein
MHPSRTALAVVAVCLLVAGDAAAATNLLKNPSFEGSGLGSLTGWAKNASTISLATDGFDGLYAARVKPNPGTNGGINASPRPVKSTDPAITYTVTGRTHGSVGGMQLCLRLREFSPAGATVKTASACVKPASTAWVALKAVSLVPAKAGDSMALTAYATKPPAGASFEVDALALTAVRKDMPPAGPTVLSGQELDDGVHLSWDAATDDNGVAGYRVSRNGAVLGDVAELGYIDGAATPGTLYTYSVRAFDGAGNLGTPADPLTLTTSGTRTPPCGTSTATPAYQHIVVFVMENLHYDRIVGSPHAPFLNQLIADCGLATNFFAITHPSLPNYIDLTSGESWLTSDCLPSATCQSADDNIFHQTDWASLADGMTTNCQQTNNMAGGYVARHNPAVYYSDLADCATRSVPLGSSLPLSAQFIYVAPNLCHDMHDPCTTAKALSYGWSGDPAGCTGAGLTGNDKVECRLEQGDRWLADIIPAVTASPEYVDGSTAIFVTWDEDGSPSTDNHIPMVVISPTTPAGTVSSTRYDLYSALRTWQDMLGVPCLASSCMASSMQPDFGL